jgi:DNA adenine methylase
MHQLPLIEDIPLDRVINVARVPHRSPFRFPGGKTWLVPRIRRWLFSWYQNHETWPAEFIEPFAGGGIVSLTVAFEQLADHVTMVELDRDIAAVWQTILDEDTENNASWLAQRITASDPTPQSVDDLLAEPPTSTRERAFVTIVRNRVNRGGILAPGAGMLKVGENGKGLRSRWYPETLKKRILAIAAQQIRERITFVHDHAFDTIQANANRPEAVFFIDPPYTAGGKRAGSRLYTHWELDHARLFKIACELPGDFLMTYSNNEEVAKLAAQHGLDALPIAMKSTHHANMTELLIGRDLDWARSSD